MEASEYDQTHLQRDPSHQDVEWGRMKHIQTRYLWAQERIAMKHLELGFIPTRDNAADLLTKSLAKLKDREAYEQARPRVQRRKGSFRKGTTK